MGSAATRSHQTLFDFADGGSLPWVEVAEVVSQTLPERSRNEIPTTSMSDLADTKLAGGVLRRGDWTVVMNYDPDGATHDFATGLGASLAAGQVDAYRARYSDGSIFQASGSVKTFAVEAGEDDKLVLTCTFMVTGTEVNS